MKNDRTYVLENFFGEDITLRPIIRRYRTNNRLAIELVSTDEEETFTYLTVNINFDLSSDSDDTLAFVDTNNNGWAEEFITKYQLGIKTGNYGISGRCVYPEYKFDLTKLNEE